MRPEDLLSPARDLARRESGKPKSVSLRRAISSSYYALFHALARLCADSLAGQKPWPLYTPVCRALEHRRAATVLANYGAPLLTVAAAFRALQEARHEADYSPEPFRFNRNGTFDLIGSAEQAITALEALSPDERLDLAIKLIVRTR